MKKSTLFISILLCTINLTFAQIVEVDQGVYLHIAKGTQMSFSGVNVDISGELFCDTFTVIGFGGAEQSTALLSSYPLALYSLRIDGKTTINVEKLNISGDIVMNKGILDLSSTTVKLRGNILNENEESYLTGGRIEKTLPALVKSERTSTGMGLNFVPAFGYDSLLVIRAHDMQYYRGEQSIAKYYEFPASANISTVDFAYLNAQSPKSTETYLLYHKTPQRWESIKAETNLNNKRIVSQNAAPVEINLLAVFPFPELNFPKFFTPNSDGINDCFEIIGIEKFPNAKFVILLPNGKVVSEISPYNNDFSGEGFSAGTYYYMFFCDKSDTKPVKKGFFEIIREQ